MSDDNGFSYEFYDYTFFENDLEWIGLWENCLGNCLMDGWKEVPRWTMDSERRQVNVVANTVIKLRYSLQKNLFPFGGLNLVTSVISMIIIFRSAKMTRGIRILMLTNVVGRFYCGFYVLYQADCVRSARCYIRMFTRFHIPLENTITATLYVAVQKAMPTIEIGLTLNRVCAVFFDGRLFNRVEKLAFPYVFVTYFAYFAAFGSTISLDYHYNFIPQSHREYYYDPLLYRVKSATKRGLILGGEGKSDLFYFDNIPTQTLPYAVVLDVWVLLKILQVKKNSKATNNAGLRLIIMALLTHLISMIPYIGRDLVGEDPDNSIFFFGDFWNFIATEVLTTFCQILLNLVIFVCLSPRLPAFLRKSTNVTKLMSLGTKSSSN